MNRKKVDHMQYQEGMEIIQSDIMEKLLSTVDQYDYNLYTAHDVERALSKDNLSLEDYGAILSPAALPYLEVMARKGIEETESTLAIALLCLRLYILPIIVKMNVCIAALKQQIKFNVPFLTRGGRR